MPRKSTGEPRYRWTGDALHIPGWQLPSTDGTLEAGREYVASELPEGFNHPQMIALDPPALEASKDGE